MTFRINVRTLTNHLLNFKGIENYQVVDGFLVFKDKKTGQIKRFAVQNTEVEEE